MSLDVIPFKKAHELVIQHAQHYGVEEVPLLQAMGRVLHNPIVADRDFPPFNRATKDGIVIHYKAIAEGVTSFKIDSVIAAGSPTIPLTDQHSCHEIMTGAVVPDNADTVVMYEHITMANGYATLTKIPEKGIDIHYQGTDKKKGTILLEENTKISAAAIGVLAAVGAAKVTVKKVPKITLISTGNELVDVSETPLPHQIRKSNMQTLYAALYEEGIVAKELHLEDDLELTTEALRKALVANDVLLLSGGVSKGKFDYLPVALENLGVKKVFHRVLQRPGKPFWFGIHEATNTMVFSFPGNPASTFANYHLYFKDWLALSLGLPVKKLMVILDEEVSVSGDLTRCIAAKIRLQEGKLLAQLIPGNGSGDLTHLSEADGFLLFEPEKSPFPKGKCVPFIPTRRLM